MDTDSTQYPPFGQESSPDDEPTTLRDAIRETWEAALESSDAVIVSDVTDTVIERYGDLVAESAQTLARAQITKIVKSLARSSAEQDAGQMSLFGFPRVLAIPVGCDDFQYMQAGRAKWADLVAGRSVRAENVMRAQARLDTYEAALEEVRGAMEGTDLTLADAAAMLGNEAA